MVEQSCLIEPVFDLFGKKWTTLILREIMNGNNHYGKLLKIIPNISSRTLSSRLRMLEENGIVIRNVYATIPPSVEYNLTEIGQKTRKIFVAMNEWQTEWKNVNGNKLAKENLNNEQISK